MGPASPEGYGRTGYPDEPFPPRPQNDFPSLPPLRGSRQDKGVSPPSRRWGEKAGRITEGGHSLSACGDAQAGCPPFYLDLGPRIRNWEGLTTKSPNGAKVEKNSGRTLAKSLEQRKEMHAASRHNIRRLGGGLSQTVLQFPHGEQVLTAATAGQDRVDRAPGF